MNKFTSAVFFILLIAEGCTRGPDFPPTPPAPPQDSTIAKSCLDFSVEDSAWFDKREDFIFDSAGRLIKHNVHIPYDSTKDWNAVFTYENGNMVKSYMYMGYGNSTVPYTTSEYTYSGNVLTGSKYYFGDLLLVHSEYAFDSSNNLITYTQHADNFTYQFEPSYKLNLYYDDHSNLLAVTNIHGDTIAYCLNYDNRSNPYYKLPYDFAYDVTHYFPNYFSKNNNQTLFDNFTLGATKYGFMYQYDNKGRIMKADQTGLLPDSEINTLKFIYKCN